MRHHPDSLTPEDWLDTGVSIGDLRHYPGEDEPITAQTGTGSGGGKRGLRITLERFGFRLGTIDVSGLALSEFFLGGNLKSSDEDVSIELTGHPAANWKEHSAVTITFDSSGVKHWTDAGALTHTDPDYEKGEVSRTTTMDSSLAAILCHTIRRTHGMTGWKVRNLTARRHNQGRLSWTAERSK